MAPPPGTLRVGRYFLAMLAFMALLYALVFLPGERHTPKLGLDLVGGTQVIFQARTTNGTAPTSASMRQAQQIIQERVNGTGVTEATVVIQGTDQLIVSIPGGTIKDAAKLGAAAVLNMRGLVAPGVASCNFQKAAAASSSASASGSASAPGSASASASGGATAGNASGSASGASSAATSATSGSPAAGSSSSGAAPNVAYARPLAAPTGASSTAAKSSAAKSSAATSSTAKSTAATSAAATTAPAASASSATVPARCIADSLTALQKTDPSLTLPLTDTAFNALSSTKQQEITAALSTFDCNAGPDEADVATKNFIACDKTNTYAYLLGPVVVAGRQIDTATAQAPNVSNGQTEYTVALTFKNGGTDAWAKYTSAHNIGDTSGATNANPTTCSASTYPCADFVGFTLDGKVISIPVNEAAINGGTTQISGNFQSSEAQDLADQLRYGALPLSFRSQQAQTVSATLGSSQLKAGLLAGGIGLALVVVYSLIYYRGLGLVTIASLIVSGGLTYAMLVLLGTQIGFVLSLAGIAGFIVAVGITADSFVVFFERIKDEVHEGRSVRVAVPRAWVRARRTILSADTVSFLAAAILYYFAAGDVKGFAFTLGLSTILDLVVVFLFTHPMVSLLSRSRAFGSARFTGLDSVRVGGIAPDTGAPAERARARRATGTKPAKRAGGGVAVLTKPTTDEVAEIDDGADDEIDEPVDEPVAEVADDHTAETPRDEPERPRRRTTPEAGSAAERAAARRARMRERNEKGGGR